MKNKIKILVGVLALGGIFVVETRGKNEIMDYLERKTSHFTLPNNIEESDMISNDYEYLDKNFNLAMKKVEGEYGSGVITEIKIKPEKDRYQYEVTLIDKGKEYELNVDSKNLDIFVEEEDSEGDLFLSGKEYEILPSKMISIGDILERLKSNISNTSIEEIEFKRRSNQATWTICRVNGLETVVDAMSGEILGEYVDD